MINRLRMPLRTYEWFWIVLIALVTTVSSEIKLIPFANNSFRLGLGGIVFFLLLLIRPTASVIRTSIVTGITVMISRSAIDSIFYSEPVLASVLHNVPAAIFYVLYGIGYYILHLDVQKNRPFVLGCLAVAIEVVANGSEQIMRYILSDTATVTTYKGWLLIVGAACFRSFFVVGIYYSIAEAQSKERDTTQLQLSSAIHTEAMYLEKMMVQIEQVMVTSYTLYRQLKKEEHDLHQTALQIAQEIHEVKKDAQRVTASLGDMRASTSDAATLSQLLEHVRSSNESYARHLQKNIAIKVEQSTDYTVHATLQLLAMLNNLVANAVEAMKEGTIVITVNVDRHHTYISINDEGVGIASQDYAMLFEPGYTTKFDQQGVAATGIGLSHVRALATSLDGEVLCDSKTRGACFTLKLLTERLKG